MILPFVFVYLVTVAFWFIAAQSWMLQSPEWVDGALKVVLWVVPTVVLVMPLRRDGWLTGLHDLGLNTPHWRGVCWTAVATVPMVVLVVISPFSPNPASIVSDVMLGPFAEEVLYRGFLFQQLVVRARWPWYWAAFGSAFVFALAHFKDLDEVLVMALLRGDLAARVGALAPPALATVVGGFLFAWMTWRWRSLWPAMVLHAGVNLWWALAPAAAGSPTASAAHGTTLVLATLITMLLTKTMAPGRQA